MENALELKISSEAGLAQPTRRSTDKINVESSDQNLSSATRQYTPSETLRFDSGLESSNESNFRTPVGSFSLSREPGLPRSHATIDLVVTTFCFIYVHFLYLGSLDFSTPRTIALYGSVGLLLASLSAGGAFNKKRLRTPSKELLNLLLCWLCAFSAIGLFIFLTKTGADVSRVWLTTSMLFALVLLSGVRLLGCLGFVTVNKVKSQNIIVCGNAPSTQSVMHSLNTAPNSRVRVARVFEFPTNQSGELQSLNSLRDPAGQIMSYVEAQRQTGAAIEQVWIAVSKDQSDIVEEISASLVNSTVDVCVVPDHYSERLLKGETSNFGQTKVVNISEISLSPAADQFKRVFDVIFASLGLLVLFIPMAIIACIIKVESKGPALFRQKRYGIDGKEIEVLKFRSMLVHSDSEVRQATKDDSRVTRVGKILRSTSLDELPQLLNVLRGSMSLVGPRPHASAHNERWRNQINGYMLRHKVRPGITGWAQVNGWRGETETIFKMQQRVKFDLEYIQTWSPWLDIKILFFTVITLARDENAY